MISKISEEMIRKAKEFAKCKQPTSYPRFNESVEDQLERLFVGKLGEIIGQEAFKSIGIPHICSGKFEVVEEMGYRDSADCTIFPGTDHRKTVDFKTAWKPFHTRLLVPEDMFVSQEKDIYVGIKVDLSENLSRVYGYTIRGYLKVAHPVKDFGEGPAYWVFLEELKPLNELKT